MLHSTYILTQSLLYLGLAKYDSVPNYFFFGVTSVSHQFVSSEENCLHSRKIRRSQVWQN